MIIGCIYHTVVEGVCIISREYASVLLIGMGFIYSFFVICDMLLTGNKHQEGLYQNLVG